MPKRPVISDKMENPCRKTTASNARSAYKISTIKNRIYNTSIEQVMDAASAEVHASLEIFEFFTVHRSVRYIDFVA
jgi:hypothetical protein